MLMPILTVTTIEIGKTEEIKKLWFFYIHFYCNTVGVLLEP